MDASTDSLPAEEHDAQKPGLQKEGSHHLKSQKRRKDVAHPLGKVRKVCTKFKLQYDTRDYPYPKIDGEDLYPETVHAIINLLFRD